MIMNVLSGKKDIKNARPKKQKQKKNSYLLLGIHQGGWIDAFLMARKRRQKNCQSNRQLF